ncbi:MAG: 50S ribosomal protein L31e [Candidatus Micrarchaeota archaeon]|nr:50S ribosomal protein L31e [Candidatus Micrarchaeota archaeon]
MAEEKKAEKIERVYTFNLSKAFKTVRQKRAKRAVKLLKEKVARHLKTTPENVKLSNALNSYLFSKSMKNPPKKVKIRAIKEEKILRVYLFDEKIGQKEEKKEKKEKNVQANKEQKEEKKEEKKPEEKKETKS